MKKFKEFINEVLITFGGQKQTRFGQVVILAGGAGSGKGFVLNNLVGIDGWKFDVDELKTLAMMSHKFTQKVKDVTGYDLTSFDLHKPKDVSKLHDIVGGMYKLDKKYQKKEFKSALLAPDDRKPNLIFDVTLKDIGKLSDISRNVLEVGYKKENIHIVWIANDIEVAKRQNKDRDRVVPEDILVMTHEGAAFTFNKIIGMGKDVTKYLDGFIYIAFAKVGVDNEYVKSGKGGGYLKSAKYIKMKERGKPPKSMKDIGHDIKAKLLNYIPDTIKLDF